MINKNNKIFLIILSFFTVGLFSLFITPVSAYATTYYVDSTGGSNSNNGTDSSTPWQTIAKVNGSAFSAGDSVLFKRGEKWHEQLTVPSSGASGNPITFGAYGTGNLPIISGADLATGWVTNPNLEPVGGLFASGLEDESNSFTTDFSSKVTEGTNALTVSPIASRSGLKSARTVFDGTSVNAYAITTVSAQSDIYVFGAFKLKSGFKLAGAFAQLPIITIRNGSTDLVSVKLKSNGSNVVDRVSARIFQPTPTDIYLGTSGELVADTWYTFEVRYKKDPSVGGAEFWLNNVSKGSVYNLNTNSRSADTIFVGAYRGATNSNPDANNEYFFDDIKVANSKTGTFFSTGPNIWAAPNTIHPIDVDFDNVTGTEQTTKSSIIASRDWYWDNGQLYIYSTVDPATVYTNAGVEAYVRSHAILAQGKSHLIYQDLELLKSTDAQLKNSGYSVPSTDILAQRLHVHNGAPNAFTKTGVYANCIDGVGTDNLTVQNSTVHDCTWNGITVTDRPGSDMSNILIQNNEVYNNYHNGIDFKTVDVAAKNISQITVQKNNVYNNQGTQSNGIYFQQTTGDMSDIIIYNNLSYRNYNQGILMGANTGHYFGSTKIYNNTVTQNGQGGFGIGIKAYLSGGIIKNNNIFNNNVSGNSTKELNIFDDGGAANTSDYNNIYNSSTNAIIGWNSTSSITLADLRALGQETHGISADPKTISTSDFHLQSSSPAIDVGTDVGLLSDFDGNSIPKGNFPDIGAYESLFSSVISTGNTSQSSNTEQAHDPNCPQLYKYCIMAGPNHITHNQIIVSGSGDADKAKALISDTASIHDIYVSITKITPETIGSLPKEKRIILPWQQKMNTVSELYKYELLSAFNGYPISLFDKPVTIILPYDKIKLKRINTNKLRIAAYDMKTNKWIILNAPVIVNIHDNTVSTTTKQFSYFAVVIN